jgi:hypothetical protein
MLKSKDITHFVSAKISELRADEPVPTDLHLFLTQNRHVILWKPAGTVFSEADLKKYHDEGLESIWIHAEEWTLFENFLHSQHNHSDQVRPPEFYQPALPAEAFLELIRGKGVAQGKSSRERAALIAVAGRTLMKDLGKVADLSKQKVVNSALAALVKEIVTEKSRSVRTLSTQIWQISANETHALNAVNVATYSVLFSMAFGHFDETVLTDISLAALLYRVGLTQTSTDPTSATLRLIEQFAPDFSQRARTLIPKAGEPRTEVAQLIAMAAALDSCCSGQDDGTERTFLEGLDFLKNASGDSTSPLSHERVSAILKWVREDQALAA